MSSLSPVMQMVEYSTGVQTALQNRLARQNAARAPAEGNARHINVQTSTGTRLGMVASLEGPHNLPVSQARSLLCFEGGNEV